MPRPKNKDEYRQEMAEAFANVLEEKGLEWRKEWLGTGGSAPQNGITKACYRGSNAFWLSLVAMMKGYKPMDMVNFAVASSALKHTIHGDANIIDQADTIRNLMNMSYDIKR